MKFKHFLLALAALPALLPLSLRAGDGQVTLIHMGDVHGHLIPRPHLREDDPTTDGKQNVGGLAYLYGQIKQIRQQYPDSLLINTGDTIQGSAEALYTKGQALVDVLNEFGIDAFAPGNWEFLYGPERFRDLFAGDNPQANWHALAANLYETLPLPQSLPLSQPLPQPPLLPQPLQSLIECVLVNKQEQCYLKKRVLPSYMIKQVGNVKVGIIGLTAKRGPQIISAQVLGNLSLTSGKEELKVLVPHLRDEKEVDLLILISELGLALNLKLVEEIPGVDLVLSSDMHEETWHEPLRAKTGTLLVEEGQDGTMLGELHLTVKNRAIADFDWKPHRIISNKALYDPQIGAIVKEVRKPFVTGSFREHSNPINDSVLRTPIDTVIGETQIPLHRSNFSNARTMQAVVEGSSHDFLSDAFKAACQADVGIIRGFRYGTHIRPGPIKLEDLYHYIPIGPQIACGQLPGYALLSQLEDSIDKVLSPNVDRWGGGWLYGYSGLNYELDPYQEYLSRISNVRINGQPINPLHQYSIAGYWYNDAPNNINAAPAGQVQALTNGSQVMDATEVVVSYLKQAGAVNPTLNRITLLKPLPPPISNNREFQPLRGATKPKSCAEIKANEPSASDGIYNIDPDGAGGNEPFDAYCDMTTDGGGWTLVTWNSISRNMGTTTDSKQVFDDQPVWDSSDLGVNSHTRLMMGEQFRMQWESDDGMERQPRFYDLPENVTIKEGFKNIPATDEVQWKGARLQIRVTEDTNLAGWSDSACKAYRSNPASSTKEGNFYIVVHDYVGCKYDASAGSYWAYSQADSNNNVSAPFTKWFEDTQIERRKGGKLTAWIR